MPFSADPNTISRLVDPARPVNRAHPLARGLRGWWMAPPNSGWHGGAVLRDACRRYDALRNTTGMTWEGGSANPPRFRSVLYDGTNYHDVGKALSPAQPLTILAVVKGPTSGTARQFVGDFTDGGGFAQKGVRLGVDSANKVAFTGGWGPGSTTVSGSTALTAGTWYAVGATLSGTSVTIYLSGASDGTGSLGGTYGTSTGNWLVGKGGATSTAWNTSVTAVALWNRALTAREVREWHELAALGFPELLTWVDSAPRFWSTAGGDQTATPGVATVTITGVAPAASGTGTATATPGVATVTLSGVAPAASGSGTATATPGTADVTITGIAPAASATGSAPATPSVATVTVSGVDASAGGTGTGTATPGAAVVTLTGVSPAATGTGTGTATPGVGTVTLTGVDVSASGTGTATATPGVGVITVSGVDVTASGGGTQAVTPGSAQVDVLAFSTSAYPAGAATAVPGFALVNVSGVAPIASLGTVVVPDPGDVRFGVVYDSNNLPDPGDVRAGVVYG